MLTKKSRGKRFNSLGYIIIIILCFFTLDSVFKGNSFEKNRKEAASNPQPSVIPDRIILTWEGDPINSQDISWRTDPSVTIAFAEISPANSSPDFVEKAKSFHADTVLVVTESGPAHHHSVNFTKLSPNSLYAYRVGSGDIWSEWFHFRTASKGPDPFTFIYFGDAQNNLLSLWSRTIRAAYSTSPSARFIIHAGDLVNQANNDQEWGEWFRAGGWINAMMPSIPVPGNHEYARNKENNRRVSKLWKPHFRLPVNGVTSLKETVYFIDYQGVRIIALNSNEKHLEQKIWLEKVLKNNPNRWTFVTFHHPIYSSAKGRDNPELRKLWKPVLDKYRVDMVLQGHDHSYARGRNLPLGINTHNEQSGTVYVVSVSGPKMYEISSRDWMDRAGENTQLFQKLSVTYNKVEYQAITATGRLYDAFEIIKQENSPNRLVEKIPEEHTFSSNKKKQ